MCIIIDTNCLSGVFRRNNNEHHEYKPVLDWIITGNGKVIYGGTKYAMELKSFYTLFKLLKDCNKAISIDNAKVDQATAEVTSLINHKDFDDQHIVGLLLTSGCKLICSKDKRASSYFKHLIFYKKASSRPKIYSEKKDKVLLINRNIARVCKSLNPPSKERLKQLKSFF